MLQLRPHCKVLSHKVQLRLAPVLASVEQRPPAQVLLLRQVLVLASMHPSLPWPPTLLAG